MSISFGLLVYGSPGARVATTNTNPKHNNLATKHDTVNISWILCPHAHILRYYNLFMAVSN